MGGSYFVPRSVKGESRILFIFTIKSFILTIVFALIGLLASALVGSIVPIGIFPKLVIIVIVAAVGYVIGAVTIPDSPVMGPLRKAGGENIFDILLRLVAFRGKKKIYLYDYKREEHKITKKTDDKGGENNGNIKWN